MRRIFMNSYNCNAIVATEPEVRWTAGGEAMCIARFRIAVPKRVKKEGESNSHFFNAVAFGKKAEFVEKYIHKGSKVLISGSLEDNSYTNKEGKKVSYVEINVGDIEFNESKEDADKRGAKAPQSSGYMPIPDEE